MANIALWLFTIIVPLVKKVLVALGIGVASYAALNALFAQVQAQVVASYGAMPATILQLLALGGMPTAIGIILSAMSARVAMLVVNRYAKIF